MEEKTVNVELTEEELKQIASGNIPPRLRKRFGYEGTVVSVTETFEFVIADDSPLSFWSYGDGKEESSDIVVKNLEDFRNAFENHRKDLLRAIEQQRYRSRCGFFGDATNSPMMITCDDEIFEVK